MTGRLAFDVSHLLAGGLVLISFMLLYQNRLYALLNVFALQAVVSCPFGCLASLCARRATSLYHRRDSRSFSRRSSFPCRSIVFIARLGIHREVDTVVGIGRRCLPDSACRAVPWW